MPTSITRAWNDSNLSDATQVNNVDDRVNEDVVNVRERLLNGGHKVTTTATDAKDGIHQVAAGNYDANHWAVYDSTATIKVLDITDSGAAITGTLSSTGAASLGSGTTINSQTALSYTNKRIIEYVITGIAQGSSNRPAINEATIYVPQGVTGWTVLEWSVFVQPTAMTAAAPTLTLYKRSETWVGDQTTTDPALLFFGKTGMGSITINNGSFGARSTTFSTATATAGDAITMDWSVGTPPTSRTYTVTIHARVDWP